MVDAGSGWVEAFESHLRTRCMVSDNATKFVSREVTSWLANQGIRKVESPPYNPASNGLAERGVKTIRRDESI